MGTVGITFCNTCVSQYFHFPKIQVLSLHSPLRPLKRPHLPTLLRRRYNQQRCSRERLPRKVARIQSLDAVLPRPHSPNSLVYYYEDREMSETLAHVDNAIASCELAWYYTRKRKVSPVAPSIQELLGRRRKAGSCRRIDHSPVRPPFKPSSKYPRLPSLVTQSLSSVRSGDRVLRYFIR